MIKIKKSIFNLKTINIVLVLGNLSLGAPNDIISNTAFSQGYLIKSPALKLIDRYSILYEVSGRHNKVNIGLIYRQMRKNDFWGVNGRIGLNAYQLEIGIGVEYEIDSFQFTVNGYGPLLLFQERVEDYQDTHSGLGCRVSTYLFPYIDPFFIGAITRIKQVKNGSCLPLDALQGRVGVGCIIKFPYFTIEPCWTADWNKKYSCLEYSGFNISVIVNPRNTFYPVSSLQSRMKEDSQWYRPSYYHDEKTREGKLLIEAIRAGNINGVKAALYAGAPVNYQDILRRTSLHEAVKRQEDIVSLLLEKPKIDVNARDVYNRTPLHEAVFPGNEAIVNLLLAKPKIDVNARDKDGSTPLHEAVLLGKEAIVNLLLAKPKIDVNARDKDDRTPLHEAVFLGNEAIVNLLLAKPKIDVNARDKDDRTPLGEAVFLGNEAIVNLLRKAARN